MDPIDLDAYYKGLQKEYPQGADPEEIFKGGVINNAPTPEAVYYHAIYWFLIICGLVAVLSLIYGGVLYVTAAGEAEKAEKGKKTIIGSIVGIIIIMLSYSAYNYIIGAIK